jgi:hypothetical protein
MNSEDRMAEAQALRALKALKQADADCEASPATEARLLTAFRTNQPAPKRATPWLIPAALAAAVLLTVLLARFAGGRGETRPVRNPTPVVEMPQTTVQEKEVAAMPERKHVARSQARPPLEIVTEFFPLMDSAPPLGRGQLLRVAVPASAMRSVGLPVREERLDEPVQADVLIGEEGMVRAIRFVSRRNP